MEGISTTQLTSFGQILGLGTPEMVVILVILLLLFGAKKLPELARSLGTSAKELRRGMTDEPAPSKSGSADVAKKSDWSRTSHRGVRSNTSCADASSWSRWSRAFCDICDAALHRQNPALERFGPAVSRLMRSICP